MSGNLCGLVCGTINVVFLSGIVGLNRRVCISPFQIHAVYSFENPAVEFPLISFCTDENFWGHSQLLIAEVAVVLVATQD